MGKHVDKIGSYENFRAPWETEAGSDTEIDKSKLKRLIFNLKKGEAEAQDSLDEAKESNKTLESDLEEAKKQAEDASGEEAAKKIAKLERDNASLKAERDKLVGEKAHNELRSEVLGDLDPKYAKYVTGENRADLEKSLEQVKADFGLGSGGDGEEDDDELGIRTQPRSRTARNGGDPDPAKGAAELNYDEIADQILGNDLFR